MCNTRVLRHVLNMGMTTKGISDNHPGSLTLCDITDCRQKVFPYTHTQTPKSLFALLPIRCKYPFIQQTHYITNRVLLWESLGFCDVPFVPLVSIYTYFRSYVVVMAQGPVIPARFTERFVCMCVLLVRIYRIAGEFGSNGACQQFNKDHTQRQR